MNVCDILSCFDISDNLYTHLNHEKARMIIEMKAKEQRFLLRSFCGEGYNIIGEIADYGLKSRRNEGKYEHNRRNGPCEPKHTARKIKSGKGIFKSSKFETKEAIKDISFQIKEGEMVGIVGLNGAGKSTTMNMITGYIASTEGTVKIDGHDILEEPEAAKKCIGYLPEQPPVYFDMTVLEYMKFVADLKKIPKDKKANMIEEVMDMVKISDMRNRLIKNLSKGYRQRVGLAEAIMGYPEVIILDEPTVGLDPKQIIEIRTLIKELKKKHTVILSSHILF